MKRDLLRILQDFPTIDLNQLNASARFMERIENKYIVDNNQLQEFFKKAGDQYYVLQINNNIVFSYENMYMDTQDYHFYHEHEHKKHKRIKLRTRKYVDNKQAFFEYKQREWKLVRKFRYECKLDGHGKMTDASNQFYAKLANEFYPEHKKTLVSPSISTNYQRITLCSKNSDERVTIDFNLELSDLRNPKSRKKRLTHFAIIENKSTHKHATSHKILKELGIKSAKSCSKYCLGVYYFKKSSSRKTFQKTINHIEKMKKTQIQKPIKAINKLSKIK